MRVRTRLEGVSLRVGGLKRCLGSSCADWDMLKEGRVPVQSTEGGGGLGTTIDAKAQLINLIPRSRKKRKGDPAVDAKSRG